DQIGKRPPFATVELLWSPCGEDVHLVSGFVHPPTEDRARAALALRGNKHLTTVKGLEGSCDLPRSRTAIIGFKRPDSSTFERLLLHPSDYDLAGADVPLFPLIELLEAINAVLQGQSTELMRSAIWNGGFYLWHCGISPTLESGLAQAEKILKQGQASQKLQAVREAIATCNTKL
ncbi:MAG: hypothetical protein F6K19_48145, partial [Cyanothece sp. SIO1E1]|nr:hypothetical protein [Cyanothece sp. SIO1E1]